MKILHIETGKHLYGGAKQVQYIIEGLEKLGIENILCCPESAAIGDACKKANIKTLHTKSAGDLDFSFLFQLTKILKAEKPDLVHLHSRRGADILGAIACHLAKTPCVLSRRVDNPEAPWLAKRKYKLYKHVITISEGIKNVLVSEGVSEKHITCVRSAVIASQYQNPRPKKEFLNEFNLEEKHITIGIIAQLIQRKGHRYLFESAKNLIQKHPHMRILVLGKGSQLDTLRALSAEQELADVISFEGFRSDLNDWLGNINIIAHPADMEGLGVSLIQASAAGIPIVGSNAGGIPEIVRDGENGFIIEPGNTQQLAEKLDILLSSKETRSLFGQTGKKIAEEEFSIETMVRGNLNVYKKILSENNLAEI